MKKILALSMLCLISIMSFGQLNIVNEMSREESKSSTRFVVRNMSSYIRVDENNIYYLGDNQGAQQTNITDKSLTDFKPITVFELRLGNEKEAIEYMSYLLNWIKSNGNGAILTVVQDSVNVNIYKFDGTTLMISNGDAEYLNAKASEYRQMIAMAFLSGKGVSFTNKSKTLELLDDIFFTSISVNVIKKFLKQYK